MVDSRPPFLTWLDWANARLQRAKLVGGPLLARVFFHLGVLAIIAFSLEWVRIDPARFSLVVEVAYPERTPVPQAQSRGLPVPGTRRVGHQVAMRVNPDEPVFVPPRVNIMQNLLQASVPRTIIPERLRRTVITYTVASGDNILTIAKRFDLDPNTVIWANEALETMPDLLYVGQELTILPIDGVFYTVGSSDTLESIATQYKVSVEAITQSEYNGLELAQHSIVPGQKLVVPGGVKTFEPRYIRSLSGTVPQSATRGTGNFVWPVGGYISQGYWDLHQAIDIAGAHGDGVVAADSGYVTYAKWDSNGYGNLVVIDHGNGFVTYYAHLYGFYVDAGESVQRGQLIGARGSTGHSTGSHLHFEIRYDNLLRNPLAFLPGQ
ncbi:MAG: M23 family metallopeptidase [Anaerolineae bacterium]|nr:M23 family metallopeptidase [Anaerolineae bacterium]